MEEHKKDRLNHLAKKSREAGSSEEEKLEQAALREEYIREFRAHFQGILDHTVIQRPDGSKTPLREYRKTEKDPSNGEEK